MKYIPASEVEKLGKEWDLAGDIEDGADRYELCLAHCAERLRALLAFAVELPEPVCVNCGKSLHGIAYCGECNALPSMVPPAPDDKLREAVLGWCTWAWQFIQVTGGPRWEEGRELSAALRKEGP